MTNDELKEAFIHEKPVEYNGSIYKYVSAIIYRKDVNGRRVVQAELMDKNAHSVIIVDPSRVSVVTETS